LISHSFVHSSWELHFNGHVSYSVDIGWNKNIAKCLFFYICNPEMARWGRKSWYLGIQSQFSMSKIITQINIKNNSVLCFFSKLYSVFGFKRQEFFFIQSPL
jgi:hypothetical protein